MSMKNLIRVVFVALTLGQVVLAADVTVIVGDYGPGHTVSTSNLPWRNDVPYSETQYGIPANVLAPVFPDTGTVTITEIGWWSRSWVPPETYTLTIFLSEAPDTYDMGSLCATSFDHVSQGTKVVEGLNQLSGIDGLCFATLDTPFTFNTGNALIVTVCDTSSEISNSITWNGNNYSGNGRYRNGSDVDCDMMTEQGFNQGCENMWLTTSFIVDDDNAKILTMLPPGGIGSGTVTPAEGSYGFFEGKTATIVASPGASFEFDYWEVDGSWFSENLTETIVMDDNYIVQAFFTGDTYELTILPPVGAGSVTPEPGVHVYLENQEVELLAFPDPFHSLAYWKVDGLCYSGNPTESLTMDDNHTVQAYFISQSPLDCDQDAVFSQTLEDPILAYYTSDANKNDIAADHFSGLTRPIAAVEFWGAEAIYSGGPVACVKPDQDFIVRFFEFGPFPGFLVYEETVPMKQTYTTIPAFGYPASGFVKKFSGMLNNPVSMENGWVSVQAVDSGDCWFWWAGAGPTSGASDYDLVIGTGSGSNWMYGGSNLNLALCLVGEEELPSSIPTMGLTGIGILLLALGSLMSFTRRKK